MLPVQKIQYFVDLTLPWREKKNSPAQPGGGTNDENTSTLAIHKKLSGNYLSEKERTQLEI